MRDVRRYIASLHATVVGLEGQVALVDLLSLEAIRVFLPDTFKALIEVQEALTSPREVGLGTHDAPGLKASIEHMIKVSGDHSNVARSLIVRVFPAGRRHIENMHYGPDWLKTWLRKRQVAHPDILKLYLERVAGERLEAFRQAERAFEILGDEQALTAFLDSLSESELGETISALESFEDDFPASSAEAASIALMNQLGRVPERPGGFFTVRPDIIVDRVVLRLLRRIESSEDREEAARRILPKIRSLSARFDFLDLIGHWEGAGHKLVSAVAAAALEAELRTVVRAAAPAQLAKEFDVFRLLLWTKRDTLPEEPALDVQENPELHASLLKSAISETRSQTMGSRAVRRRKVLAWDALLELAGSEDSIRNMIDRAATMSGEDGLLIEAIDLARRYLDGWRPDDD